MQGNLVACNGLNLPVYPGSSNISVGGAGIFVGGVQSGNQATDINIVDNTVVACGSSETNTPGQANIEVGDVSNFRVDQNNVTSGRFIGVLVYDQAIGQVTGNTFNGLVSRPIAANDILITITTAPSHYRETSAIRRAVRATSSPRRAVDSK